MQWYAYGSNAYLQAHTAKLAQLRSVLIKTRHGSLERENNCLDVKKNSLLACYRLLYTNVRDLCLQNGFTIIIGQTTLRELMLPQCSNVPATIQQDTNCEEVASHTW